MEQRCVVSDTHHCIKSGNIPRTKGGQIHLNFMSLIISMKFK